MVDIYNHIGNEMHQHRNGFKRSKLTNEEEEEFQKSDMCYLCNIEFNTLSENEKVREHCHYTGNYRGAVCQSCNTKEGKETKVIPVFFHNGSNYDFHFIITELMKHKTDKIQIKPLAKSSEEYISIDYGYRKSVLRFIDSYRFLGMSLDNCAKSLKDEDYEITKKYFPNNDEFQLIRRKGIFPYEYLSNKKVLKDKQLPPINEFFSTLRQETITEDEYNYAKKVWNKFNCKNFKDYMLLYLKVDVLILAEVFEKYRKFFLNNYGIDPARCYSAPGLSWNCGLKYTNVELDLLSDLDMVYMFENGIRGGFSGVLGKRYVKANNKYLQDYDPNKPSNYLLYVDCTNLYGYSMTYPLPTGDFKWETNLNYFNEIPSGRGCIIECDLEYTNEAKLKTHVFPVCPEKLIIKESQLSELQKSYLITEDKKIGKTPKLILNMENKSKYIVYHETLKYYIKLGMKVTKVYRIISFKESPWLKTYIDFNTEERRKATMNGLSFEKQQFKTLNVSIYGKTMEDVRKHINLELHSEEDKVRKLASRPNFKDFTIFNDNLIGIMKSNTKVILNKPIYTGQVILDLSKLHMYKTFYEVFKPLWGDNVNIITYDTDSFFLEVNTEDIYEDIKGIKEFFDLSLYQKDFKLHDKTNQGKLGTFKDELAEEDYIMTEIVALRSKAYSYKAIKMNSKNKEEEEFKKAKGIGKTTIKKYIQFEDYKNCIFEPYNKVNYYKMHSLNSINHEMFVIEKNKKALSPYDDKRFILKDGIKTLPHTDDKTIVFLIKKMNLKDIINKINLTNYTKFEII
jgi:hypothetical protein